ncbi:hypothetical protein PG988_015281 [Apiospora saccharicola]
MPRRGNNRGGRDWSRGGRQNQQGNNRYDYNRGVQESTAVQVAAQPPQPPQPQQPGQYYSFTHNPHGYGSHGHPYSGGYGYTQPPWGYRPPPAPAMPFNTYQAPVVAPPPPPPVPHYPHQPSQAHMHPYQAYRQFQPPQPPLQPPPPLPAPPQPAGAVTNPYDWGDTRHAEWERSYAFIFGQGQSSGFRSEPPNTFEAPQWESMNRRARRRGRRLRGTRRRPVTPTNHAFRVESNSTKDENGVEEEDDIKSEPMTP